MTHRVQSVDLAVRRSGSTTWVAIDPTSSTGRRFRARLTNTYPMEDAMTAAAAAVEREPRVPLSLINDGTASQTGFWLRLRSMGRRAWDYLMALPRRIWNGITGNPAAQKTGGWLSTAWAWVKTKVAALGSALGIPGLTGAGLLTITTSTGQRGIAALFAPVSWLVKGLDKVWCWSANQIGRAPWFGSWVADRMMDVEEFFAGNSSKPGVIGRGVDWLNEHVKPWLDPKATHIGFARAAGLGLLGFKMPAVLALFPLGWALAPLQWLFVVGFGIAALGTAAETMEDFSWWTRFLDNHDIGRMRGKEEPKVKPVPDVEVEEAVAAAADAMPKMDSAMNRAERRGSPAAQTGRNAGRVKR